jgi:mevalonate kinase
VDAHRAGNFLLLVGQIVNLSDMTTASAPGKIILFGEHAVVYGRPALAVPVTQVHADVEILASDSTGIWIHAPDIKLHAELNTLPSDHPIASVIHNFLFLSRQFPSPSGRGVRGEGGFPNLQIKISSTIPVASGLGSGAAVTVALVRALSAHLNYSMKDDEINAFAYDIEKLHHGTPSGIDNTVITYAKPVYFVKGQPIEVFKVGKPFTIVIGDTGIAAPTKESVADVRKLWEADKTKWEGVFDKVGAIARSAKERIETGDWRLLGELMNQNHALLQEMTVSSPELDRLVEAARNSGALGAKLSGGGRGGNMIALVERENAGEVSSALIAAGAKNTIVTQIL